MVHKTPTQGNVIPIEAARAKALPKYADPSKSLGYVQGERGSYELKKSIFKSNGTTELFVATDLQTSKEVIVKRVKIDSSTFKLATREFDVISSLAHPNVVKAIDQAMISREENGHKITEYFLITEKVEGKNLREHSELGTEFTREEKLEIIKQLLTALEYLHNKGIVHRDVKPENVIVERTEDGKLKVTLIDFGVTLTPVSTGSTAMLPIFSKGFTAPEVLACEDHVDGRADIYSTCAVLGWMFTGLDGNEFRKKIKTNGMPDAVDDKLKGMIKKGLELEPDNRYQSAKEFKEALISSLNGGAALVPVQKEQTALAKIEKLDKEIAGLEKALNEFINKIGVPVFSGTIILFELVSIFTLFKGSPISGTDLFILMAGAVSNIHLNCSKIAAKNTLKELKEERQFHQDCLDDKFKGMLGPATTESLKEREANWSMLDVKDIKILQKLNFFQMMDEIEKKDLIPIPDSFHHQFLVKTNDYKKIKSVYPARTGTMVIYPKKGKTLGEIFTLEKKIDGTIFKLRRYVKTPPNNIKVVLCM